MAATMKIRVGLAALAALLAVTSCSGPEQLVSALLVDHEEAQRKTVKDIRDTGAAMFGWFTDHVGAAAAGQSQVNLEEYTAIAPVELKKLLVPQYLQAIPEKDGWGHPYEHYLNPDQLFGKNMMGIRSPGRDGRYTASSYAVGPFDAAQLDSDIVWADGFFVAWPEGGAPQRSGAGESPGAVKDREAQKQTVADIRETGTALYSWLTDQVGAAAAGEGEMVDLGEFPAISHREVSKLLVPQYLPVVAERDGWGHPYEFRVNVADPLAKKVLAIRSPGRDGAFSVDSYIQGGFEPDELDQDIVWADGFFVRWPSKRTN